MTWARWASSWSSQAVSCGSVVMRERVRAGTDIRIANGPRLWIPPAPVDGASAALGLRGPLAALALVHGGHPGDPDGVPLLDHMEVLVHCGARRDFLAFIRAGRRPDPLSWCQPSRDAANRASGVA